MRGTFFTVKRSARLGMKAFVDMNGLTEGFTRNDNWDRRSGIDRRRFSYTAHIPERRCGEDRRGGVDRRSVVDFGSGVKLRGPLGEELHYALDDGSKSPYAATMLGSLKHWFEDNLVDRVKYIFIVVMLYMGLKMIGVFAWLHLPI